jgi:glyoxylase-like metal-dependent hydrolase (beta-lactamase superfamily II)
MGKCWLALKETNDSFPSITLDLNFQGLQGVIASYLIPHRRGGILIESGPGSTVPTLVENLKQYGLAVDEISDVFLTHIHLDHAGAAGWLAARGASTCMRKILHLLNPETARQRLPASTAS